MALVVVLYVLGAFLAVFIGFIALSIFACGYDGFLSKLSTFTGLRFSRVEKRVVFEQRNPERRARFLVVAFSGGALKIGGMPREEFKRTLAGVECDQLFLIDPLQSWYLNDPERKWKGIRWFSTVLEEHRKLYEKTLFIGNCMGGTGALLFSNLADCVLVFNPLVNLKEDTDRIRGWYARNFIPRSVLEHDYERTWRENVRHCPRVVAHFGTGKHFWHKQFLPEDKVEFHQHDTPSGVVTWLKKRGVLVNLIKKELESFCSN